MGGPVSADRLTDFAIRAFRSLGVPDRDAKAVASLMIDADLLGYDTHGLFRLRQYVTRLRDGGCNAKARPHVVRETAATALIDGDNGLGHLAMVMARDLAMAKARLAGIGWVGVRQSCGASGALCSPAGGGWHDRDLCRRGQCQPCGALWWH